MKNIIYKFAWVITISIIIFHLYRGGQVWRQRKLEHSQKQVTCHKKLYHIKLYRVHLVGEGEYICNHIFKHVRKEIFVYWSCDVTMYRHWYHSIAAMNSAQNYWSWNLINKSIGSEKASCCYLEFVWIYGHGHGK